MGQTANAVLKREEASPAGRESFRRAEGEEAFESESWMPIGATARATGLSPDTLRVWQKRYGFPLPSRKPSGHRLYNGADLHRLRRISLVVSRGYRPSEVIGLGNADLEVLIADERSVAGAAPADTLFEQVRRQQQRELISGLMAEAAALGPLDFLRRVMIPLIDRVGEGWTSGEISAPHERLFTQAAEDVLRALREVYERGASGPRILVATLTGEMHRLGIHMAGLVTGMARLRPQVIGENQSVAELAFASEERQASAIAVGVSAYSGGAESHRQLLELRRLVPPHVAIVAGWRGAAASRPPAGVWLIEDLEDFHGWLRRAGIQAVRRASIAGFR